MNNKGVSAMVAAVLLIAVTVSLAALVSGWLTTIVHTTQVTISNVTATTVNCMSASVVIDDVYISAGAPGSARAIVRNSGQADDLAIQSAYIYNRTGEAFSAAGLPSTDFDRGEVVTLMFNAVTVASCPGDFIEAIATTDCPGISGKFSARPKCS